MNAEVATVIAVVTLSATVCGWVIRGARTAEKFQQTQTQAKKDADGIARMLRDAKSVEQRRWLHEIADTVEESDSQEKRNRVAKRIREDAWRN